MANWPRSIKPEDRIKYLIQARSDLGILAWYDNDDGVVVAVIGGERIWASREGQVVEAWYASNMSPEQLIGEFDDLWEAQKALYDHLVVTHAISQAWEDVAT